MNRIFAAAAVVAAVGQTAPTEMTDAEEYAYMYSTDLFGDRELRFERMRDFKEKNKEEEVHTDEFEMFGENFSLHNVKQESGPLATTPKVGSGYEYFDFGINNILLKFGTGYVVDAKGWADVSQSRTYYGMKAVTAQTVLEASVQMAIVTEYLAWLRQEIHFDLSLIKIRPILVQRRKTDTSDMTIDEMYETGVWKCWGWYSELRILPMYMYVVQNFRRCAYSLIHVLVEQDSPGIRCDWSPNNVISTERFLAWQGYRATLPIIEVCGDTYQDSPFK